MAGSVAATRRGEGAEGGPGAGRDSRSTRWLRRHATLLVSLTATIPGLWTVFALFTDRLGANPIREVVIETGLWTLRFLALTLLVTPVRRWFGWNAIARQRRTLGIVTFVYACVHLLSYAGLDQAFVWEDIVHDVLKHRYTFIGMATWLLLLPLALTSTTGSIRRLGGRRWNRLHRLVYVAAITGTVHYLWAVKKDTTFPLVYLFLFTALLGVRLWWWMRARAGRALSDGPG